MTTPAVWLESWVNPPPVPATVPAGASPGFLPGATDTWVMAGGWAAYPQASPAAHPPTLFRLIDRADPREQITVRQTTGPAWQVIRGAEGSIVVAHDPGFEVHPFVTAQGMTGRAQGAPSGNGLATARGTRTAPQTTAGTAENTLVALDIPGGEARPGSVYEAWAWGYLTPGGAWENGLGWGTATVGTTPAGGISLAGATADARWRMHGLISFHVDTVAGPSAPPTAAGSTGFWVAVSNATNPAPTVRPYMHGPPQLNYVVETGLPVTFRLWAKLTAGGTLTVLGGRAWRAA